MTCDKPCVDRLASLSVNTGFILLSLTSALEILITSFIVSFEASSAVSGVIGF